MKKLSVIVPSYNEENRIEKTLYAISQFLQKQTYSYEILVINDGSKDNTAKVVNSISLRVPNLRLIDNKDNHGKGWVTKQGMLAASGDIRLFMDADNSTKVDEIQKMVAFFDQGFDAVVGSRRIEGSNIAVKQSAFRDFLGGIFRLIVHILVPVGVTDSQCGFKAFSETAAKQIFSKQTIFRWAFDVEILALARKFGYKIKEVPVTWIDDSESHVKFSGMVRMLLEILEIRINLWTGKYNDK